jgi:hypothetical protein
MARLPIYLSETRGPSTAHHHQFLRIFADIVEHRSIPPAPLTLTNPAQICAQIGAGPIDAAAVTVVLIGPETWRSRDVDWAIAATLCDGGGQPRAGLLGILLPGYKPRAGAHQECTVARTSTYAESLTLRPYWSPAPHTPDREFDHRTIPRRLSLNVPGFAKVRPWTTDQHLLQSWLSDAVVRARRQPKPIVGGPLKAEDAEGSHWRD